VHAGNPPRGDDSLKGVVSWYLLRSGAGLRFSVLRVLSTGTAVELLGTAGHVDGYEWAQIRIQQSGQTGYVASEFLSPVAGGTYPIGSTFHVDTSNGGGAFLRAAASTSSAVVKVVANGTNGTIQSAPTQAGGYTWYQVSISGSTGWMATVVMAPGAGGGGRPQVRVSNGPLNVRQTAGLSGTVILVAPTGATGEVTEQMPITRDGYVWVNVHFFNQANTTGWVAKNFLTYV
jgi:uncharacterized protein YgiM (DUF1202 family)